jgi:homeobox protein cut-like
MVLETQISDLQREATRLITALDEQKLVSEQDRTELSKTVEDVTKERDARAVEVDELKARLQQYADYDEVKRELEIMKVSAPGGL